MNKLFATVSALALLSAVGAQAQPISGFPYASEPLSGSEAAIGTQSAATVQIKASSIANLTFADMSGDVLAAAGGNVTVVSAAGNFTVNGNLSVLHAETVTGSATVSGNLSGGNISTAGALAVTGAAAVTGNVSGGNLSTGGNITVTGLGTCVGGLNTSVGVMSCTTPTWASGAGGGNSTAPGCTTLYRMMGLGGPGNASYTPTRSGQVQITVCGTVTDPGGNTTAGTGINLQLSYGTGAAPANNAALTGTQTGAVLTVKSPATVTAVDVDVPVCTTAVASITVNTAYWVDVAAEAIGVAGNYTLTNTYVTVIER